MPLPQAEEDGSKRNAEFFLILQFVGSMMQRSRGIYYNFRRICRRRKLVENLNYFRCCNPSALTLCTLHLLHLLPRDSAIYDAETLVNAAEMIVLKLRDSNTKLNTITSN